MRIEPIKTIQTNRSWLRSEAVRSDRLGQMSEELRRFIFQTNIHMALVPEELGGSGLSFREEFSLLFHSASISASFGWLLFQLIGNVARVLSFLPISKSEELLATVDRRLILAYYDQPNLGRISINEHSALLSGLWGYGSLAIDASHFACPCIEQSSGAVWIALLERERVCVGNLVNERGLRSSSTAPYRVHETRLEPGAYYTRDVKQPSVFWRFQVPRAHIKHLGYGLGAAALACELMDDPYSLTSTGSALVRELRPRIEAGFQTFLGILDLAEQDLLKGDLRAVQKTLWTIENAARAIHTFLREVSGKVYEVALRQEGTSNPDVQSFLDSVHLMCLHGAVRKSEREMGDRLIRSLEAVMPQGELL